MEMVAVINAVLLILFALLGSGTAIGDRQVNIPVRLLNNGNLKNSNNKYVVSAQYSQGNSSPQLAAERSAQNSVVWSSNSATELRISTARPVVANIKEFPVRKATKPLASANMKTSPSPNVTAKAEVSSETQKTANQTAVPNVQISATSRATNLVNTKSRVTHVQQPTGQEPYFQKTIVSEIMYPDSFISAQIAAASLTTPSPDTYVKPAAFQQNTVASSHSSWHIQSQATTDRSYSVASPVYVKPVALQQVPVRSSEWQLQSEPHTDVSYTTLNPLYTKLDSLQQPVASTSAYSLQLQQTQTPIDRSYSVLNPEYANSVVLQPDAIPQTKLQPQLQMSIDRAYSSLNPTRYYPYNTFQQSTLVEPYIDKRNQKYKQYSLLRQPSQHLHGSYPLHSVHAHPYSNYHIRRPPIERESPQFFKPYPTKYVNFPSNRFPTPYDGLLKFSRHKPSYKDSLFSSSSSGSIYYKILFPLALLGISIPALGMMYTYLSKRRRRRSSDDLLPSVEDIEYYMQVLQKAIETYDENDVAAHAKH